MWPLPSLQVFLARFPLLKALLQLILLTLRVKDAIRSSSSQIIQLLLCQAKVAEQNIVLSRQSRIEYAHVISLATESAKDTPGKKISGMLTQTMSVLVCSWYHSPKWWSLCSVTLGSIL
jgi:hypothetical protein